MFGSLAQADYNTYCANGNCTINAREKVNSAFNIPFNDTIDSFNNYGDIFSLISNHGTITAFNNYGEIYNLSNYGTITTLSSGTLSGIGYFYDIYNYGTITTLNAFRPLEKLHNYGTITTLSTYWYLEELHNYGTITTLSSNDRQSDLRLNNYNNITTLSNEGVIVRIDNSATGNIGYFNNIAEGVTMYFTNDGTIDVLENKNTMWIMNSTNGTIDEIINSGRIHDIMLGVANRITNSGTIENLNNINGTIDTLTNETSGDISNLDNQGTIDTLTNSNVISNLTNGGTIDTFTNSGTISRLNNTGTLAGGIVNERGGTMTLNSTGSIGLNANGLHISNANNVEKAITIENISMHSDDKLKVDAGVKGGIFIRQITAQVEREVTLEDLIDEQGVRFGSDCQNENCIIGLDEDGNESEFRVFVKNSSVLLDDFYAERGQEVRPTLDTHALSGSTFHHSLIANNRLRDIRIDAMLREFNIKNFQTNFENSKESNLESLESYRLGKSEKYASLTQDTILLENAELTAQTWNDEDLMRELDDIFVANKNGEKYYTFIVPYFSYDSFDIGGGDITGHTRGFLAGIQTPLTNDAGIVGAFFGYERADKVLSSPSFNGSLGINDISFLTGVSYYNVFHRKELVEYYLSGSAKLGRTQSKINRGYEGGETKAKPKSIDYGVESKVGANIYNIYDNSVLSPEIGLAYQGISTENYTLNYGSVKEHYYSEDTNFVDVITALRWQRAANPTVKYNASLGAYWNLYEDGRVRGIAAGIPLNKEVRTSDYFAFTNMGITYAIRENAELSFDYNGILGDKTQSHTGYVRLGIWW